MRDDDIVILISVTLRMVRRIGLTLLALLLLAMGIGVLWMSLRFLGA